MSYFNGKNYNGAIIEFKNTLEIDPNHAEANYYLGTCYLADRKFDNALKALDKAIESNPELLNARLDKAYIHIMKNQLWESSKEIKYVLNKDPNNDRAYNLRGNIRMSKRNYGKAFDDFKKSIALDQKSIEPRLNLVRLYLLTKNYKEAEIEIKKTLNIDNKSLQTRLMQSKLYLNQNRIDDAIEEFKIIISQYPKKAEGYVGLADIYLKRKMIKELKALANSMLEKDPKLHLAKLFLGIAFSHEYEYEKAVANLQQAVKHFPQNSQAHYNLGIAYYASDNHQQAISEYLEALKLKPNSIPIMATLATVNLEKGWHKESIEFCKKALDLSPRNGIVRCLLEIANIPKYTISHHHTLSVIYFFNNDYSMAVDEINKALEKNKEDPFAYSLLGNIYLVRENIDDAIANYELSLKIEPKLISSLRSLAFINILRNDLSSALSYLKKALVIEPSNVELHREIAMIYDKQGKDKEAISHLEKAIELNPQSVKTHLMLSKIYLGMGEQGQAISTIQRVIELEPSETSLRALLANIYLKQERFQDALDEYEEAIELSPEYEIELTPETEKAYNIVGLIYMAMEKQEQALSTFELLLEKNPENIDALIDLAILHNLRQEYEDASDYIEKVLEITEKTQVAHFIMANIYASQKQYRQAEEEYIMGGFLVTELRNKRIDIADYYKAGPSFVGSHLPLMVSYLEHNWIDMAVKEEKNLFKKSPDNSLVNYAIGLSYVKKDASKAVEYFENAAKGDSRLVSVHHILGDIYGAQQYNKALSKTQRYNYLKKAVNEYQAYLQGDKDNIDVLLKVGMLFEQTGDYKSAVTQYENILEINPNAIIPLNNLAWNFAERDIDLDRALVYAKKAVGLDRNNFNAVDTLGWTYCKRGDYKEALKYIKKATELNDKHPSIYYHLAYAYYRDDQKEEAVKALKTSLSLADNFPEVSDAKELLKELQD